MAYTPYNFFDDIGNAKKMLIEDPIARKDFKGMSFVVLRALSFHIDAILIVDQINNNPGMSEESMYRILTARIRKMRRKWLYEKALAWTPELEAIQAEYGYSLEKALEAQKLLSKDFVKSLVAKHSDFGGTGRAKRRK